MSDVSTPQLFPDLPKSIEDALHESIRRFGVLVPVVRDQHGKLLDGRHRARIADDLGVGYRTDTVTVADDDEAAEIQRTLNADRRHLDPDQRREVAAALRQRGHSYRAIGGALGVSHVQAMKDVAEAPTGKHLPVGQPERVMGLDGKSRPATRPVPEPAAEAAPPPTEPPASGQRNPALYTSDSPEWHTPQTVIDRTVKLLGRIDLDPCSNSRTDPNVPAAQHFTIDDDGLAQVWHGLAYMNPPYGGGIGAWVDKLVAEHRAGNVPEAVALVPARTDTAWFGKLRDWPRCFVSGRLRFSGHENSAPFPSAVVYLGERLVDFAAVFGDLGDVYVRYEP